MATTLTRSIAREVQGTRGPLIVRFTPAGMEVKEKGRRAWFGPVSWQHIHTEAARLTAAAAVARKQPRRARRGKLSVGV